MHTDRYHHEISEPFHTAYELGLQKKLKDEHPVEYRGMPLRVRSTGSVPAKFLASTRTVKTC